MYLRTNRPSSTRRRLLALFAALASGVGAALVAAASVAAQGPPIVNETMHFADEVDVFVDVNPCKRSQAVEITSSNTGVIHFTVFADATAHVTGTGRSTVSWDFLPTDGTPDATGSSVFWFGSNGEVDLDTGEGFGKGEKAFTFSLRLILADGTRIRVHRVGHIVFNATGVEKISFEKLTAHCG
jgi:hypothetical protein